jgi:hypothetical protein
VKKWPVVAVVLVGLAAAAVATSATTGLQEPPSREVASDTLRIPVRVIALDVPITIHGIEDEVEFALGEDAGLAPIRFRSAKRAAVDVRDNRAGDYDRDGRFLCVMDHDAKVEGLLEEVHVTGSSEWTMCVGIYQNMPLSADSTVKCVKCPYSRRLVCGSNPDCME